MPNINPTGHWETMTISGDLDTASFLPWIERHANKLGLQRHIIQANSARIEIEIEGPVELIDAMEMACSLGPISVMVDRVDRIVRTPSEG